MGLRGTLVTTEMRRREWTDWFAATIQRVGVAGLFDELERTQPGVTLYGPTWPFKDRTGNMPRNPWVGSASRWNDGIHLQLSCPMAQGELMVQQFETATEALDWLHEVGIPVRPQAYDWLRAEASR